MERGYFPGTPTTTTSLPGDPTLNHPYDLTPGTSTEIILNNQSTSANVTDSCARDTMTAAATADIRENLLPTRTRNQAHRGIILCLPSQQTRARSNNLRPIPTKLPCKDLASSSQITDRLALKCEERSTTFWALCPTCRMLYEYINIFLNQELLCHECEIPFMATKVPAPSRARVQKFLSDALHHDTPFQC